MLTKQCARPGCLGLISERYPSRLKLRTYCKWRCVQWAAVQARLRGNSDARRGARRIHVALGLTGEPSRELIRAVQRIRTQAYNAGWQVVTRKVRRAIARGILIHRRPGVAA